MKHPLLGKSRCSKWSKLSIMVLQFLGICNTINIIQIWLTKG